MILVFTVWYIVIAWCVAMCIIPSKPRHETKKCGHVILGVLFLYSFDFFRYGDITDFNSIEQPEPFTEAHEVINAIETATDLKHDIFGTLIIADDKAVFGIMSVETDKFVKNIGIFGFIIKLRAERTYFIDETDRT